MRQGDFKIFNSSTPVIWRILKFGFWFMSWTQLLYYFLHRFLWKKLHPLLFLLTAEGKNLRNCTSSGESETKFCCPWNVSIAEQVEEDKTTCLCRLMSLALVHGHKYFSERILAYQKHKEEIILNVYENTKQY